ncbi:hypothetical protein JCM12298_30990 [Desulfothermus naphthae]
MNNGTGEKVEKGGLHDKYVKEEDLSGNIKMPTPAEKEGPTEVDSYCSFPLCVKHYSPALFFSIFLIF